MKLTITDNKEEELQEEFIFPDVFHSRIVIFLRELGVTPVPQRTSTIGADQTTPAAVECPNEPHEPVCSCINCPEYIIMPLE